MPYICDRTELCCDIAVSVPGAEAGHSSRGRVDRSVMGFGSTAYGLGSRAAAFFYNAVTDATTHVVIHTAALGSALYIVSKLSQEERLATDSRFAYIGPPVTEADDLVSYRCRRWAAAKCSYRLTLRVASGDAKAGIRAQAALLQRAADVPHVQRWAASFEGHDGTYCLVTEALLHGFLLSELLEKPSLLQLSDAQRGELFQALSRSVLEALAGLHELNIVHGNLGAASVYVTALKDEGGRREFEVTLVHFSAAFQFKPGAKVNGELSKGPAVGAGDAAAAWAAPEVVDAALLGPDAGYAIHPPATDVWAAGCLLLQMASGLQPFASAPLKQLHKQHRVWATARKAKSGKHPVVAALDSLPVPVAQFIARMLAPDPTRRITAADALQLPFFTAPSSC